MSERPRFSILMPTHNRADVVGFAIKSVLAQTEPSFELLIVGDGCTDDTANVVAVCADPRIRWFDLPKAPHFGYANRNFALREARGELVAFAAHDDLLFPDHLARLSARLEETGAEWVYSRPLWVSPDGVVMPLCGNLKNADELARFLQAENFIPASCIVHTRACLEKYGYWREDLAEAADWELWRRIIEGGSCENFAYDAVPTTLHFKANWRKRLDPAVTSLVALAKASNWWPQALRLRIDPGGPEQAVFSQRLHDAASGWVEEVRRAVVTVVERLAWEHTMHGLGERDRAREEAAILASLLRQRDAEIAELTDLIGTLGDHATALRMPLSPPAEFREQLYLQVNPDVAEAVQNGEVQSGFEHWLRHGRREHRPLRP